MFTFSVAVSVLISKAGIYASVILLCIALYCNVLVLFCPSPVDSEGCFLSAQEIHCPYLIKNEKYWLWSRLYRSNPSGHSLPSSRRAGLEFPETVLEPDGHRFNLLKEPTCKVMASFRT